MRVQQLDRVSILGAGVLGGQIAWHSAYKGKTVVVYDISDEALENCRRAQQQNCLYPSHRILLNHWQND